MKAARYRAAATGGPSRFCLLHEKGFLERAVAPDCAAEPHWRDDVRSSCELVRAVEFLDIFVDRERAAGGELFAVEAPREQGDSPDPGTFGSNDVIGRVADHDRAVCRSTSEFERCDKDVGARLGRSDIILAGRSG